MEQITSFDNLQSAFVPTLVLDRKFELIRKNEFARKYFDLRIGTDLTPFLSVKDRAALESSYTSRIPVVVTLVIKDACSSCLAIPVDYEKKTVFVCPTVPYTDLFLAFTDPTASFDDGAYQAFSDSFAGEIAYINSLYTSDVIGTEEERQKLKLNLLKFIRLDRHMAHVHSFRSETPAIPEERPLNLCRYIPHIVETIRSLSNLVGYQVNFKTDKPYLYCRTVPSYFLNALLSSLMFCLKFNASNAVSLSLEEDDSGCDVLFEPSGVLRSVYDVMDFDYRFLAGGAKAGGFSISLEYESSRAMFLRLHIPKKVVPSTTWQVNQPELFIRVTMEQLRDILSCADSFFGDSLADPT